DPAVVPERVWEAVGRGQFSHRRFSRELHQSTARPHVWHEAADAGNALLAREAWQAPAFQPRERISRASGAGHAAAWPRLMMVQGRADLPLAELARTVEKGFRRPGADAVGSSSIAGEWVGAALAE